MTKPTIRPIIGISENIFKIREVINHVANTGLNTVIYGESGVGKELIADAVMSLSDRSERPFIKVHCAALTETLLESELFGHEKGAFTGAIARKRGRFELAHTGTILLDEIGEISPAVQIKLLRVLQEKRFERVGGEETVEVDVRVIAATNKDLLQEIEAGAFREDLFYRLNVVTLNMPPLRERREDVPLLAKHFLEIFAEKNRKTIKGFTPQAMDQLIRYDWPGNVRELMNAVERAVVLASSEYLDEKDLPLALKDEATEGEAPPEQVIPGDLPLEEVEKASILKTLELTGGNKSEAARRLGITRRTLHKKLKKYGVM